jgi:hypothetical protein
MHDTDQRVLQVRRSKLSHYKYVVYLTVSVVLVVFLVTCMYDSEYTETEDDVKVVAYYQRGVGNSIAFSVVLHLFRYVYPSSPLYIHWDIDHAPLVSRVDLVSYNKNETEKSTANHGIYYSSVTAMDAYIKRLKTAANLQKNGWVLLLEDDVWVLSRIKQEDLRYDISGTCIYQYSRQCNECQRAIQAHASHHQLFRNASCYGGCGGNYVNSSRILGLEGYHALLRDLLKATAGAVPSDILLSSVILADGGTVGDNPGYYDPGDLLPVTNRRSYRTYGRPNVLHHMKWLYFMRYLLD